MKKPFVLVSILLALAAVAPIAMDSYSQAAGKVTRLIELAPVEGSPFLQTASFGGGVPPPDATVKIVSFSQVFRDEATLTFRGLNFQPSGSEAAYALYLTTRPSPEQYVHGEFGSGRIIFNVTAASTISVSQNLGIEPAGMRVDTPIITCFIAFEPDDGRAFDPLTDMDRVVFVGTSIR